MIFYVFNSLVWCIINDNSPWSMECIWLVTFLCLCKVSVYIVLHFYVLSKYSSFSIITSYICLFHISIQTVSYCEYGINVCFNCFWVAYNYMWKLIVGIIIICDNWKQVSNNYMWKVETGCHVIMCDNWLQVSELCVITGNSILITCYKWKQISYNYVW